MRHVSRVVKVHRLREVIAQVGFTRFEASAPDVNGELELGVERAALSLNEQWLPAVENRGEGVFIGLKTESIEALAQAGVGADASRATAARVRRVEGNAVRRVEGHLRRHALRDAPHAVALADHGGVARLRLRRQLHPRAHLRGAARATASCSTPPVPTRRARWAAWSRPPDRMRTYLRTSAGAWRAVLERPRLRPASAGQPGRGPLPARRRVPRLCAVAGEFVRAAERLPRSRARRSAPLTATAPPSSRATERMATLFSGASAGTPALTG